MKVKAVFTLLLVLGFSHCGQAGPAPLLYLQFTAPAGLRVTAYPGGPTGAEYPVPVTLGLRPGYVYRVKLTGIPGHPDLALYPTMEVRGSLFMPQAIQVAKHPAPFTLTEDDVAHAVSGALVTKVIYLENPDSAMPNASQPNQPLEINVSPAADPLEEARLRGRLMLVIRMGEREVTHEEMARGAIPGTLLLPGARMLPPPAAGPCLPWAGAFIDPILGPKPLTEECLKDGGDVGARAGIGPDGQVHGVDPSDSVAAFSDSKGRRQLTISNRVCLCVPRYVVMRHITAVSRYDTLQSPNDAHKYLGQTQILARLPSLQAQQNEQLESVQGRQKSSGTRSATRLEKIVNVSILHAANIEQGPFDVLGTTRMARLTMEERVNLTRQLEFAHKISRAYGLSGVEQKEGPMVVGRVEGLNTLVRVEETRDLTACCHEITPPAPDKPLYLCKWVNVKSAQVGDVVTFYLKFSNHGGQPIADIAVSDSLTPRLEYIAGSAKSDRDAVFTTQVNQAGALLLHWEVRGKLLPGQSGVVSFQARIR